MDRRNFLKHTSRAAMAMPFVKLPEFSGSAGMGIVVHSYGHRWNSRVESKKYPAFGDAMELMEHCHEIGAGGVQVMVRNWGQDFAKKVRDRREKLGLYIEGSIGLPKTKSDTGNFEREVTAAREAGATVIRTVCLSGRRYENFLTLEDFQAFKKNSIASLQLAEPVMRRHKMTLALENHKDWKAVELAEILKDLDSEWMGATLDFGNNIALMDDPMEVVHALAPYLVTTHVKDMGVEEYPDGFLLSEVPLGEGFLDLKKMVEICREHRADVKFNLEMITRDPLRIPCLTEDYWSTFPDARAKELASTLRMVRQNHYEASLPEVSHLSPEQRLAAEEKNVVQSLQFSKKDLGLE